MGEETERIQRPHHDRFASTHNKLWRRAKKIQITPQRESPLSDHHISALQYTRPTVSSGDTEANDSDAFMFDVFDVHGDDDANTNRVRLHQIMVGLLCDLMEALPSGQEKINSKRDAHMA